jgi:hypothetical protein
LRAYENLRHNEIDTSRGDSILSNLDSIITLSNVYTRDSTKFHTPLSQDDNLHAAANTPGIRHITFAVECIDAVVADLCARGAELVGEFAGGWCEVVEPLVLRRAKSMPSAAVFSSSRETRLVPGIGVMSSRCASSHAKATCAGPSGSSPEAIAWT